LICDSHTHCGHYYDTYTSPQEVVNFMEQVGVDYFAVSSTTICAGLYDKVLSEFRELKSLAHNKVLPVLWILPQMFEDGTLDTYLDSGIPWVCLKIHPQLHPQTWKSSNPSFQKVALLANKMQLPLLIHTGEHDGCYPLEFEKGVRENPKVTFILAHSRPVEQTINMIKRYPNVWADTAFSPMEDILRMGNSNLSDRILWGTDYPIQRHFDRNIDLVEYYRTRLEVLRNSISKTAFEAITNKNFQRLFSSYVCSEC